MVRTVDPLLGTRAQIGVDADDGATRRAAEDAVVTEASRLEQMFTTFAPDSALRSYRRTGMTDVAELQAVIDLAQEWERRSSGLFDPGLQAVVELWDRAEETGTIPTPDALAEAVGLDRSIGNLNAIAKGWIADRAVVAASGAASVWLNLGGDVVHRGAGSVTVGVEDPHRPYDNAKPLTTVELANAALATSSSLSLMVGSVRAAVPEGPRPENGMARRSRRVSDGARSRCRDRRRARHGRGGGLGRGDLRLGARRGGPLSVG